MCYPMNPLMGISTTSTLRSTWLVESVRLTAFPVLPVQGDYDQVWEKVMGAPPSELRIQRNGPFATYMAEVEHDDGFISLRGETAKVDWLYSANSTLSGPGHQLDVGSFDTALSTFERSVESQYFATAIGTVNRLALGLVLLQPVESRQAGYTLLNSLVEEINVDPERARDMVFRVNYRRPSGHVPGLQINRLAEWSVVQLLAQAVEFSDRDAITRFASSDFLVRLAIDVNSAPEHSELVQSRPQEDIYSELKEMAVEIVETGGVR